MKIRHSILSNFFCKHKPHLKRFLLMMGSSESIRSNYRISIHYCILEMKRQPLKNEAYLFMCRLVDGYSEV